MHPPSEIKSNYKFKTLRWRPLKWRVTLSELEYGWTSTAGDASFLGSGSGEGLSELVKEFPAVLRVLLIRVFVIMLPSCQIYAKLVLTKKQPSLQKCVCEIFGEI